ncbi:MAG: hypothetical protein AAGI25_17925 [Bacteroidota bacterium]
MKKYKIIATAYYPGAEPKSATLTILPNFELKIKPLRKPKTFVPLRIPNFKGNTENKFIEFEIEILKHGIDEFSIEILYNDKVIYTAYSGKQVLDEVIITAKRTNTKVEKENLEQVEEEETPMNYPIGKYAFKWDGFDRNGIYDSTLFTSGKLKARVKGKISSVEKIAESEEFSFEYKEVKWVDVKIDENTKRIDVTLRVNLRDGGEIGTEKDCKEEVKIDYLNPGLKSSKKVCPWDKIPKEDLISGRSPIKSRTKNFADLEQLALEGLNYHWGRNRNHFVAKNVDIHGEKYEVFVNSVNTTENAMDDISLIFNTNSDWLRSMNPGSVDGVISFFGQVMPERIIYNYGYIKEVKSWYWLGNNVSDVNDDFSYTSAHEIGHEILKRFSNKDFYSYKHKGSSTLSETLPASKGGVNYPMSGEIDLMKYYNNDPYWYDFKRIAASKKDVLK